MIEEFVKYTLLKVNLRKFLSQPWIVSVCTRSLGVRLQKRLARYVPAAVEQSPRSGNKFPRHEPLLHGGRIPGGGHLRLCGGFFLRFLDGLLLDTLGRRLRRCFLRVFFDAFLGIAAVVGFGVALDEAAFSSRATTALGRSHAPDFVGAFASWKLTPLLTFSNVSALVKLMKTANDFPSFFG